MKTLLFILTLSLASAISYAGFHTNIEVGVSSDTAYGSMVAARNSADNVQHIGCDYIGTLTYPIGRCGARNAAGVSKYCYTTNAHHVEQIRGLSNESYLYFQWDSGGNCTYIGSSTGSVYHE